MPPNSLHLLPHCDMSSAPSREKIGIDLRNHGKSPHLHPQQKMTYQSMAEDLATFLDDHRIEKACLVGHSMGGKVAMHLALSYPSRVSELVVVDIAPIDYTIDMPSGDPVIATRAMRAVDLRHATSRAHVDQQLKRYGLEKEAVRQFVMTNLVADSNLTEGTKYRWKVHLEAIESSLPEIMKFPDHQGNKFDGPTCLIRGGKSKYVPFQSMRVFTSLFPNTKLVTISDAGHWLQAQMPDEFCRSVNDFLND